MLKLKYFFVSMGFFLLFFSAHMNPVFAAEQALSLQALTQTKTLLREVFRAQQALQKALEQKARVIAVARGKNIILPQDAFVDADAKFNQAKEVFDAKDYIFARTLAKDADFLYKAVRKRYISKAESRETGSLLVKRIGSDETIKTAPRLTNVTLDHKGSPKKSNPAVFSRVSAGTHEITFSDVPEMSESIDTCTYASWQLECIVSVFGDIPQCDGDVCNFEITVEKGMMTKVAVKYLPTVPPLPVPSPTPSPTPPPPPPTPSPSPTPPPPPPPPPTTPPPPSPPAEPQAYEGFGASTIGGQGGTTYHVTNLNDSGAGSFREGLIKQGNRTIVFDTAGTIVLKSDLDITSPFTTVDGFSAPAPGITLQNAGIRIHGTARYIYGARAHDVIVRGLRIRNSSAGDGDGIQIGWGAYNVVIDHVSVSWSNDGNIDITHGAHDVTVQWSILDDKSGKNMLLKTQLELAFVPGETKRLSLHHNIFTSSLNSSGKSDRNPRISNIRDGSLLATEITADVTNNIIANWARGHGTDVECGAKANIVGNIYTSPASPAKDQAQAIELRPKGYDCYEGVGLNGGFAYVYGNINHAGASVEIYNDPNLNSTPANGQVLPYAAALISSTNACVAATGIKTGAGMRVGGLDTVDSALIAAITIPQCTSTQTPPQIPTPLPTPPPPPAPSAMFIKGDRIEATSNINVRQQPYGSATIVTTQKIGSQGTILNGPYFSGGMWWWKVTWDVGGNGWSAENLIKKIGSATPPPTPPPSDTTLPTTSLTAPVVGTTVSGTVTISANAFDNGGVSRVEFYVDGTMKGSDTSSPYSYSWDTTNGGTHACIGVHTHTLQTRAFDVANNQGISANVSVNMNNPSYCTTTPPSPPPSPVPPSTFSPQGFGSQTVGGNNGTVVHVTNLNNSGPGSLRDAVSQGNRKIIFDIGGNIGLTSDIVIPKPFVTIDGSTAPAPGITINNAGFIIHGTPRYESGAEAHDVIIKNVRIRNASNDGIGVGWGAYNVLIDHVTVSDSKDGNIDITHGAHDVTVQWSLIGPSLAGKNMLIKRQTSDAPGETNRVTLHHNALTTSNFRNPRISNGIQNTASWATDTTVDMRNNIVFNWKTGLGTDVECGAKANIVQNFYSDPGIGVGDQAQAVVIRGEDAKSIANSCQFGADAHVSGNFSADNLSVDINTNPEEVHHNNPTPFASPAVTTTSPCGAARQVIQSAGSLPHDTADQGLFNQIAVPATCI